MKNKLNKTQFFICIFGFLALINIFYFITLAASPVIRDDGWYFLDSFHNSIERRGLEIKDFFEKRSSFDHALPLNRFLSLINYYAFKLDYRFESIIGFISLFLIASIVIFNYNKKNNTEYVLISALLIICSLNSTNLYTWPMVTLGFLSILITIFLLSLIYSLLNNINISPISFFLVFIGIIILGDNAALITIASVSSTILFYKFFINHIFKNNYLKTIIFISIIALTYYLTINWNFIGNKDFAQKVYDLKITDIFQITKIIFTSSLIHREHFVNTRFENLINFICTITISIGILHYLIKTIKNTNINIVNFVILSLFLITSISIFGIVIGRVPTYGIEYLYQPRYVLTYQLIPFLLLCDYALDKDNYKYKIKYQEFLSKIIFIACLGTQLFYSYKAFESVEWISRYINTEVHLIGKYYKNIDSENLPCTYASNPLCGLSIENRRELLSLLVDKKLNIFNEGFQWRYRLFPFSSSGGILNEADISSGSKVNSIPELPITIDLSRRDVPSYVIFNGLGDSEKWGRWSISKEVKIQFGSILPSKFILSGVVMAYGPNRGKVIKVVAGQFIKEFVITADGFQSFDLEFIDLKNVDNIKIFIPEPTKPNNGDERFLGIGFRSISLSK